MWMYLVWQNNYEGLSQKNATSFSWTGTISYLSPHAYNISELRFCSMLKQKITVEKELS